jgi:hypothetical protein
MALIIKRRHVSAIQSRRRFALTTTAPLTHDEQKAAEAAFRGLPINPSWSQSARHIYQRIVAVTNGRDIVTGTDIGCLAVGGTVK